MKPRPANRLTSALPFVVTALVVGIYGCTVWLFTDRLEAGLRDQLLGRDGEALYAVAQMDLQSSDGDLALLGTLAEPLVQEEIAMRTSRLRSVMAFRLFSPLGELLNAFPPEVTDGRLTPGDLDTLSQLRPVSHFRAQADLAQVFITEPEGGEPVPLIEVNIPFHEANDRQLLGVAQFIVDGTSLAGEFAALEASLRQQAWLTFALGGLIIAGGLAWAFARLHAANLQLRHGREQLIRANRDLADTARTSALGAISAHLVHGLINPLTGLQGFFLDRHESRQGADDEDWAEAVHAAQRMQAMVQEVVRVLRDESHLDEEQVTCGELAEMVRQRVQPAARNAEVELQVTVKGTAHVSNHTANLVVLILTNLLQNAIQATPAGQSVTLSLHATGPGLSLSVEDHGPGIPEAMRADLFKPRRSTKSGGNGIGLAISKQLANHLGATLELTRSSARGSVFTLVLPGEVLEKTAEPTDLEDIEPDQASMSHGSVATQN